MTTVTQRAARELCRAALELLGVRRLVLAIHDPAFPALPEEDLGRGSPYSAGARRFVGFVRDMGFDGLQLGPQGATSESNPSPYDATLFSRNPLSIALLPLVQETHLNGLLPSETLAALVAQRSDPPDRVRHQHVFRLQQRALAKVWETFRRLRSAKDSPGIARLARGFERFRRDHVDWLERDGLYELLCLLHGTSNWRLWLTPSGQPHPDQRLWSPAPGEERVQERRRRELRARYRDATDFYAFRQFLFHEQHRELRSGLRRLGLRLSGDMQAGLSETDFWCHASLLLQEYVMGAPPSRTNPEGQAWNYRLLDPRLYMEGETQEPGPALRFFRRRIDKLFAEYDSLRIDHPHSLVCPWVYAADAPDPLAAVANGARLFESPDVPEHPQLRPFAIARPEQIDRSQPRHADGWVRELDDTQVERYSRALDVLIESARSHGRSLDDIVCETLSTCPYPLLRVQRRCGLGRFRVTQKADYSRVDDVYRGDNASPEDWIMLGTHDTPSIWTVTESWCRSGPSRLPAQYLANRLNLSGQEAERVASDPRSLAQAMFAELFLGPAQNVMVFFVDFFGLTGQYNVPGTTNESNWSQRLTADYDVRYARMLREQRALDLPRALAAALRARGAAAAEGHQSLIHALESLRAEEV